MSGSISVLDRPRAFTWGMVGISALLLLLPILVAIPISFTGHNNFTFPPREWSLEPYMNFFSSRRWWSSLINSLNVALATAIVATILGILASLGLRKLPAKLRGGVQALLFAPIVVPAIVIGVAAYGFYLRIGIGGTILGFIIAHTVIAIPYVLIVVSTQLNSLDITYERAASSLGSGPIMGFFTVTLPLIAPAVATGAVFAFVTSFDESVVSLFLQSPAISTLPATMYGAISDQFDVTIAAAASLIITGSSIVVLIILLAMTRNPSKKGK